jgi:NAD(P)-dependent dehydrogenase (short-subunit alcohol dehydrogenase family)
MDKKIWYVTGVSRGLGLALINRLLREGHRVAAISGHQRVGADDAGLAHGVTPGLFPDLAEAVQPHPSFFPLEADLGDEQSVADSIRHTCEAFGRIDVVVNNAGYGLGEPLAHTITVIQKVMPRLRAQRSGHIINIAPITGVTIGTLHGHAFYAAARQAIFDLSETLADDVRPLGIRVTAVLSDGFHTRNLGGRDLPGALGTLGMPGTLEITGAPEAWHLSIDGRQPGDPGKAAAALLRIATAAEPPALAYLTSNAYRTATKKMTLFGQVIASRQCATSF